MNTDIMSFAAYLRKEERSAATIEKYVRGYSFSVSSRSSSRKILRWIFTDRILHSGKGIESGPVFITRSGRPLDRSNIWSDMKKLCRTAGVAQLAFLVPKDPPLDLYRPHPALRQSPKGKETVQRGNDFCW